MLDALQESQSLLSNVEARFHEDRGGEADLRPNPVDAADLGRALEAFNSIRDVLPVRGRPTPPMPPKEVWINQPREKSGGDAT